jgi:hypothetical protein
MASTPTPTPSPVTTNADHHLVVGGAHSVFVTRTTGVLTQAANTKVILQRVNPENVFLQVASNAVVGVGAHMTGVILVKTDSALQNGCEKSTRSAESALRLNGYGLILEKYQPPQPQIVADDCVNRQLYNLLVF